MANEDVRKTLADVWLAGQLSNRCLDEMARISKLVDFPTDHLIFRQGEVLSTVYVIVHGMVSLGIDVAGSCRVTVTLGEGELLGWTPILQQGPMTASARTLRPTQAVGIDVKRLLLLFESDAQLGHDFMRATAIALAKRLDAARLQLADVYGPWRPTAAP